MKVMILADLHMQCKADISVKGRQIRQAMPGDTDLVVICGDIFESNYKCNPYKHLHSIFQNDIPVVCVLGNHAFYDRTVQQTLDYYAGYYKPDKYDVHYLDVIGHYDFDDVYRFFGNVLWYDGSMGTIPKQDPHIYKGKGRHEDWAWADCLIHDFDCLKANKDCVDQILANKGADYQVNVLCTHCCPHRDMNAHMDNIGSPYNIFSGMCDFLDKVRPDYAFCGHTHRRDVGRVIHGCKCVNVGNGFGPLEYVILSI